MRTTRGNLRGIAYLLAFALLIAAAPARAVITYVASSSTPADNGSLGNATVTINFPAGIQAGDLLLIVASHREAGRTMTMNAAGGQTWTALTANTTTVSQRYFWAQYTGTGTSASVNFSDTTSTTVSMHAFRPTAATNTWAVDAGPTNTTFASPGNPRDVTIASMNTATDGALVFATWATADDNTWTLQTANWLQVGSNQYRNTVDNDASQSSGYRIYATAGATGAVVNRQTANGPDAGNSSIVAFREIQTTTLATGTDPAAATIAPGAGVTIADNFTLTTSDGTEAITSITVNLSAATGIGRLSIYDAGGTERGFTTTPAAGNNVINVTGVTATTATATFSVRITPLSHAAMPAPNGGSYAVTAVVNAWAGPNNHTGTDTDVNALTIDNASPNAATALSGSGGTQQVTLNWTNSSSADFAGSVVLRWTGGTAGSEVPVEGTAYSAGNTIGTATVACALSGTASAATSVTDGSGLNGCSAAALAGNQSYTYRVFQQDANGNYNTGTAIGSFTTALQPVLTSATASCSSTTEVEVVFSTAVTSASAQTAANYALSGGASVTAAVLGADTRVVTLTVSGMTSGQSYTLTVNNVTAVGGAAITPNSQTTFFSESGYVQGIQGTYYEQNGGNLGAAFAFTGTAFDRIDAQINNNWAAAAPGIGTVGANGFSVRWVGYITVPTTGTYTLRTQSDDGVRLYFNGGLVIDNWNDHSSTANAATPVALTAGQYYPIRMEFYENGGDAVAQLLWTGPSIAVATAVPAANLWRCGASTVPSAIYRMDENSWNGTAGEVTDSSGNGLNGTGNGLSGSKPTTAGVSPALSGTTGTCRYGVFNRANKDFVELPATFPNLGASGSFSVMAWIRTTDRTQSGQRIIIDDQSGAGGWGLSLGDGVAGAVRLFSRGSSTQTLDTGAVIANNTWYFVAASVSVAANTVVNMYIYDTSGALVNIVNATWAGFTWGTDAGPASIGGETNSGGEATNAFGFSGNIDEVRSYGQALTQAEIAAIAALRRPCAVQLSHYAITFPNGTASATCEPIDVIVTAHDAADAAIAPGAGTVVPLGTSTGTGVWLTPLVSGNGPGWVVSGANNGVASYTWAGTETSFRAQLRQTAVTASMTIAPTSGVGAVENSAISFANTAFRVTANGTTSTTVGTHLSGKDTNVGFGAQTLYVQAIRTDTNTGACVPLLTPGPVNVEMAASRNNPTGGSSAVSVRNSGGGMTALSTGAGTLGTYGNVSLQFDAQSKAPLVINYPDAGTVTLGIRYQLPTPPSGVYASGTTNTFVVRPFGFRVSGPTTVGSPSPSSAVYQKAGTNFSVQLTAVQWKAGDDADNDGVPDSDAQIAANSATPNFGQESSAATATLSHGLNAAVTGVAGSLGGSTNYTAFASGTKTQSVNWSEVGFIDLFATSSNYLGSSQSITNSAAGLTGVGRFYPDHFAVAASPVATIGNRAAAACTPASSFTYMDEGFTVGFTLQARNTNNVVTQNYSASNGYAKLNPATIAQLNFGARGGATVLTSRLDLGAGSTGSFSGGAAAVSATLGVQRTTVPDGPFTGVQIGIAPQDSDGVAMQAPFDLDADGTAGNERKALGVTTELRWGRLRIQGVAGASTINARVPLEVQYFNGTGFTRNTADSCTTLAANTFTMSDYRVNLNACETAIGAGATFAAGAATLTLAKPGVANNGSLLLTSNLGAASGNYCATVGGAQGAAVSAVRSYLQGSWTGGAWNVNPYGRVAFGVYGSRPNNVIFMRENY